MFMGEVSIVNTNAQKRLSFFLLHFTTLFQLCDDFVQFHQNRCHLQKILL